MLCTTKTVVRHERAIIMSQPAYINCHLYNIFLCEFLYVAKYGIYCTKSPAIGFRSTRAQIYFQNVNLIFTRTVVHALFEVLWYIGFVMLALKTKELTCSVMLLSVF